MRKKNIKMNVNKIEKLIFIIFMVLLFLIVVFNFGNKPSYPVYWREGLILTNSTLTVQI